MYALYMSVNTDDDFGWDYGTYCPPQSFLYGCSYEIYFETYEDAKAALKEHFETVVKTFQTSRDYLYAIKEWYIDALKEYDERRRHVYDGYWGNQSVAYEIHKVNKTTVGAGFAII